MVMNRLMATLLACLSLQLDAEPQPFNVGYFELPPHTQTLDGSRGPALYYFDQVAARMQAQVNYQQLPLSRLLKQLENNELDAALLLAKNDERQASFVYSRVPFFTTRPALAIRSGIQSDLAAFLRQPGYSIVIWQQGYHSESLKNFAGRFVVLSGEDVSARAVDMLQKGRVDGFYEPDVYALRYNLKRYNLNSKMQLLEFKNEELHIYSVFSKEGARKFLASYEEALKQQQSLSPYLLLLDSGIRHGA